MEISYYEVMQPLNEEINFFKTERDYVFDKMEKLSKSGKCMGENENWNEWTEINEHLEKILDQLLALKKEINKLYQLYYNN